MSERPDTVQILEGDGATDYEIYIRTDELLALQPEPETWKHPDELLFTVVHQSSELWLKLGITAGRQAIERINAGAYLAAVRFLNRTKQCIDLTTDQLAMLEEMTPWDYQHVRTALGHGSGFDSPGFRNLRTMLAELVGAVQALLDREHHTFESIYLNVEANEELYALIERVIDIDEALMLWRAKHIKVIERTIGANVSGTQGTPVSVVRGLRDKSVVQDIWDVRDRLTERADSELR
jgi:tryptophan 2,3-dioxygenase